MAWLESHQSIANHPKTKRLSRHLGVSKAAAIGHLHMLWWWSLDYAQDGDLSRYHPDEIAEGAQWDGDPDVFVNGLRQSGFVDETMELHDWWDYAGKLISQRQKDADRKKESRNKERGNPKDVQRMSNGQAADIQRMTGCTVPNQPTQPTNITEQENAHAEVAVSLHLSGDSKESSLSSQDKDMSDIARLYQELGFGQGSSIVREKLVMYINEFGKEWVENALREAHHIGKRRDSTVKTILDNWRTDGGMNVTFTTSASSRDGPKHLHQRTRIGGATDVPDDGFADIEANFFNRGRNRTV